MGVAAEIQNDSLRTQSQSCEICVIYKYALAYASHIITYSPVNLTLWLVLCEASRDV